MMKSVLTVIGLLLGACLGLILNAGAAVAASTTFNGAEEFVWG